MLKAKQAKELEVVLKLQRQETRIVRRKDV